MATKRKRYTVNAKLDLLVGTEISAVSMEDALAQAKALTVQDFVTIDGEYIDGEIEITGIFN